MPLQTKTLLCFVFFALVHQTSQTHAQTQNGVELKERLHQAELISSIDLPGMKPWHLLLRYKLLDSKGQTTQTGTIEEWWASPEQHKIIYTQAPATWTEVENERGTYRNSAQGSLSDLVGLLRTQVVHPMPRAKETDSALPTAEKKTFGDVILDCIMLSQPVKGGVYIPFGLFPTYCLDHDQNHCQFQLWPCRDKKILDLVDGQATYESPSR